MNTIDKENRYIKMKYIAYGGVLNYKQYIRMLLI